MAGLLGSGFRGGNFFGELCEEVVGIMRAGACLGVVLNAGCPVFQVAQAGDCAIIQVQMGYFDICGKRGRVNSVAVIL